MPSSPSPFRPVADLAAFEQLIADSANEPIVLYLHDPYCPVSADAYDEMERLAGGSWVVDVSRQHDLKKEVARRTGVRHESPQVIVLRNGQAAWDASHYAITAAAVAAAAS